jgi:diaminopimelate decarboxylase
LPEILETNSTPIYLYAAGLIRDNYRLVKERFPGFEVLYSFKANPSLAICNILRSLGAGADVSSLGELQAALKVGFGPEDIAFVGPGKSQAEMEAAVQHGIYAVAVESAYELALVDRMAAQAGKTVRVLLRINTLERPEAPEMMVGGPSKFGFDEESVVAEVDRTGLEAARISGVHVYSASQVLDHDFLAGHLDYVADLSTRLSDRLGFDLDCIDFGGGFGVPYGEREKELDLGPVAEAALRVQEKIRARRPGCRLLLELGRFLVAEAGVFIATVIRVKRSRGKVFIVVDGGMNHFTRPVFLNVKHQARILNKLDRPRDTACNVGGPICTPLDIIAEDVMLPEPEVGDVVGMFNAGAYGYTMSMVNFMSMGWPAEVLADDGNLSTIRARRPAGHLFEGQTIPDEKR